MGLHDKKKTLHLVSVACGIKEPTGNEKNEYTDEDVMHAFKSMQYHDLSHLIYTALDKCGLSEINPEITEMAKKSYDLAVYTNELRSIEFEKIAKKLISEKIAFIPLKGIIISRYYPEKWMRNACDLDILVCGDDFSRACDILKNDMGYRVQKESEHDVAFRFSGVVIELHHSLLDKDVLPKADEILQSVMDYTLDSGTSMRVMNCEMTYYYHIVHMAKHFQNHGCGLKFFLDMYYLKNVMGYDEDKVKELLTESELLKFESVMSEMADMWFCDGKEKNDNLSKQISRYVIFGGTLGSFDNTIGNTIGEKGTLYSYLSIAFPPYSFMKNHYPVLQKAPVLLPGCWAYRGVSKLFGGQWWRAKDKMKKVHDYSSQKQFDSKKMMKELKLK